MLRNETGVQAQYPVPSPSSYFLVEGDPTNKGCGYHQEFSPSLCPPFTDGVLGLGSGETSILSQVSSKKVMALCSSDKNGPGYLVLGDSLSNSPDITWRSLANDHLELGPADIIYEDNLLVSVFHFSLDSGTTYRYFSPAIYQAVLSQVRQKREFNDACYP
ncbi:Hypothetical predicted protein [Olea europaea subsp. europaea]|uniref:Xylanase inhibitor N-terminal domain-containing protein n=1 Tax=Olea europaea subsp. europaea TaxID=158383 RepID=A0A8S0QEQ4_OLEEU|nr:Hypothetical predicted protein [Olea europaea subsp. europaea]